MYQAQPAATKTGAATSPWKLDTGRSRATGNNEDAVNGRKFAQAIALVAAGRYEEVVKKKEFPAFKKIFWDEPMHNPPIANAPESYAHDAHDIEQSRYWKRAGNKFYAGDRLEHHHRDHDGPMNPEEFPHLFERPQLVFSRSRDLQPFSRARPYNKPVDRCGVNPEKAYLDMRTSLIGPLTYQLPDPWEAITGKSILNGGTAPEQSVFKSHTRRFNEKTGPHSEFPAEKAGTSIPHSRGRSRGGGFRETSQPVSERETADLQKSMSAASWHEFQDTLPDEQRAYSPYSPSKELGDLGDVDLSTLYTMGDPRTTAMARSSTTSPTKSTHLHAKSASSLPVGGDGGAKYTTYLNQSTGSVINTGQKGSHAGRGHSSSPKKFQSDVAKSRMPGFTFVTNSPAFEPINHHKAYRRVVLPDGTTVILPVSAHSRDLVYNTQQTSYGHSHTMHQGVLTPDGTPAQGTPGPQGPQGPVLRSITPPHRVPPSLASPMSVVDYGGMGSNGMGGMGGMGSGDMGVMRGVGVGEGGMGGMGGMGGGGRGLGVRGLSPTRQSQPQLWLEEGAHPSMPSMHTMHTMSIPSVTATHSSMPILMDDELSLQSLASGSGTGTHSHTGTHGTHGTHGTGPSTGLSYNKSLMEKWTPPVYYSSKNKPMQPDIGTIPSSLKQQLHSYTVRKSPSAYQPSQDPSRSMQGMHMQSGSSQRHVHMYTDTLTGTPNGLISMRPLTGTSTRGGSGSPRTLLVIPSPVQAEGQGGQGSSRRKDSLGVGVPQAYGVGGVGDVSVMRALAGQE
jgi:hypothetical protein